MVKTIFYIGKGPTYIGGLRDLKSKGYTLGLFQDSSQPIKNPDFFDHVVPVDFSSEERFISSMAARRDVPPIDGVICTFERYIVFKALAGELLGLPALSREAAFASSDKYLMRKKFLAYDPSITPSFALVRSKQDLLEFSQTATYPLMMKPTNLVKSLLVTKSNDETELSDAFDATSEAIEDMYKKQSITSHAPSIIVEEFIKGNLYSVVVFADSAGGVHIYGDIVRITTAEEVGYDDVFLYSRSLGLPIDSITSKRIHDVAIRGVKALGLSAVPAHVEIIDDGARASIVEIGARIGGYRPFMFQQSYDTNLLEQEALISMGKQPAKIAALSNYSAVFELFPHTEGSLKTIENVGNISAYAYYHQVAKVDDRIGPASRGYRAVVVIGIVSDTYDDFLVQCEKIKSVAVVLQ